MLHNLCSFSVNIPPSANFCIYINIDILLYKWRSLYPITNPDNTAQGWPVLFTLEIFSSLLWYVGLQWWPQQHRAMCYILLHFCQLCHTVFFSSLKFLCHASSLCCLILPVYQWLVLHIYIFSCNSPLMFFTVHFEINHMISKDTAALMIPACAPPQHTREHAQTCLLLHIYTCRDVQEGSWA